MRVRFLLACALLLAPACEEADLGPDDAGAGDVGPRDADAADAGGADAASDAGTEPDSALPPGPIDGEQYCSTAAELFCDARQRCCSMAGTETRVDCVDRTRRGCTSAYYDFLVDRRTGYDPDIAASELGVAQALALDCDIGILDWLSRRDGVLRMFQGTIPRNGECYTLSNPTDVVGAVSCVTGTCRVSGLRGVCGAFGEVGEDCAFDFECADGLYCVGRIGRSNGCAERKPLMEPCTEHRECSSYFCGTAGSCAVPTQDEVYCIDPFEGR